MIEGIAVRAEYQLLRNRDRQILQLLLGGLNRLLPAPLGCRTGGCEDFLRLLRASSSCCWVGRLDGLAGLLLPFADLYLRLLQLRLIIGLQLFRFRLTLRGPLPSISR